MYCQSYVPKGCYRNPLAASSALTTARRYSDVSSSLSTDTLWVSRRGCIHSCDLLLLCGCGQGQSLILKPNSTRLQRGPHRCDGPVVNPHVSRVVVNAAGVLEAVGVAGDGAPGACAALKLVVSAEHSKLKIWHERVATISTGAAVKCRSKSGDERWRRTGHIGCR